MKRKSKTTTKTIVETSFTHKDLTDALSLPQDAQIIITPPDDYEEGILILPSDSIISAEHIEKREYTNDDQGEQYVSSGGKL